MLGGIAQDILRITTQQLVTKPLAGFLTNAIGSFLGPSFGGGKALGGPVAAGGLYRVAENRPEMLNVNGESYLLMGNQRGNIDPNPQPARSNGQVLNATINVNMPANTSAATANQAGLLVARRLRAASTRNQ
jgi:SLT domain-containing protein